MRRFKFLSVAVAITLVLSATAPLSNVQAADEGAVKAAAVSEEVYTEDEFIDSEESGEGAVSEGNVTVLSDDVSGETGTDLSDDASEDTESWLEYGIFRVEESEDAIGSSETPESSDPETETGEDSDITDPGSLEVYYSTHVQSYGWQEYVKGDSVAGTTGQAKRVEAIKVKLENTTDLSGSVEYCTHIQNYGWQEYVKDDSISGTTGEALRVEAVKIRLTGQIAEYYDIYYRVHVQNIGWTTWTSNGSVSGSTGFAKRLEAIQIKVVPKSASASERPETGAGSYLKKIDNSQFTYYTHVQSIGDTAQVTNGQISGTTGKSLRIEGLVINLNQPAESAVQGDIQYRTHVQGIGWTEWKSAGQYSGTKGQAKRAEAIQVRLTGQLSVLYDVYYSAHVQKYGWLGWAKNGQTAGTEGIAYRMEALKIKLIAKHEASPGENKNYFKNTPVVPVITSADMVKRAQSAASSTGWLIMVDTTICRVGIFSGKQGSWKLNYFWECAPGKNETPTVTGTFTVKSKGLYFGHGYTCWYYTQFYGDYLFHSVIYKEGSMTEIQDPTLGVRASHGCVRLSLENAKWIWDNIPRNTTVVIYE